MARHPQLGRAGRKPPTREFPVAGTPCILVYKVLDATLEIAAVLHDAQIVEPPAPVKGRKRR